MAISAIYFDANIFIEMIEDKGSSAAPLLIDLFSANDGSHPANIHTSELTFAEVLAGPYKQKNDELVSVYDSIFTAGGNLAIHPVEREILWQAAALRARYHGLKLPDAIHLTTAIAHGCTNFLTSDTRIKGEFDHLDSILGLKGKAPLRNLRPTEATLHNLIKEFNT